MDVLEKISTQDNKKNTYPKKPEYEIEVAKNVIVRFSSSDAAQESKKIREGKTYIKEEVKVCTCGEQRLELWDVDEDYDITPEGTVDKLLENPGGAPKPAGGLNFTFTPPNKSDQHDEICGAIPGVNVAPRNDDAVTIAVLDTGLDPDFFKEKPFIYNNSNFEPCEHHCGWSFTGDGSNGVLDVHKHGTYVTKIITSYLDEKEVTYRILPLKVIDGDSNGSSWDLLCALSYLKRIQGEGGRIDIVNLSLGALTPTRFFDANDLIAETMQAMKDTTLFVTSAGNGDPKGGIDTDSRIYRHFPSGYAGDNILSVGGYRKTEAGSVIMHEKSNFGKHSIDIAAQYAGFRFNKNGETIGPLEGTSYSAAYVTALAAEYFANNRDKNPNPNDIKRGIIRSASEQSFLRDKLKEMSAIL